MNKSMSMSCNATRKTPNADNSESDNVCFPHLLDLSHGVLSSADYTKHRRVINSTYYECDVVTNEPIYDIKNKSRHDIYCLQTGNFK